MGRIIEFFQKQKVLLTRRSPDFIIVGVQKAGTTSLFEYLSFHPEIETSRVKEVHYFDTNYKLGKAWYLNFFPKKTATKGKITGESSPYYIYHPHAIQRIKKDFPKVKIIVMLREPLKRAFSQYQMEFRKGKEKHVDFKEAIQQEQQMAGELKKMHKDPFYNSFVHQTFSYISRGDYASQMENVYKYFPSNQVLVLKSEEFFKQPKNVLAEVYDYLNVTPFYDFELEVHNQGDYKKTEDVLPLELRNLFTESNKRLAELTNNKIDYNAI